MSDSAAASALDPASLYPSAPPSEVAGPVAPVKPQERIGAVDTLRGLSLLGILLMNIVSFGLPFAAYMNPSIYGGATGANFTYWLVNQVLFENKMRAIFSMLFGASVIIMTSRAEKRGAGVEIADVYYRRTLWLILFGVIHGYLIWYGDILFQYGVVGLALFPFRKLRAKTLICIGGGILAFNSLMNLGGMAHFGELEGKVKVANELKTAGKPLSDEQTAQLDEWNKVYKMFRPEAKKIETEIKDHRGGYLDNLKARAPITASFQSDMFYQFMLWDVAGMLILGMGLMKAGVLDGSRSYRFYTTMLVAGYGIGIPLNYMMATKWAATGYDFVSWFGLMAATADPGRFTVAAGHIAVIMLLCKAGALRFLTQTLAKVGQMALSNYLLTSILCTLYFNGYGFGMFARLQRHQLLYVVVVVWLICLIFSTVWLRYFRFGPVEWLWRSLTYVRKQPLRRTEEEAPAAA